MRHSIYGLELVSKPGLAPHRLRVFLQITPTARVPVPVLKCVLQQSLQLFPQPFENLVPRLPNGPLGHSQIQCDLSSGL